MYQSRKTEKIYIRFLILTFKFFMNYLRENFYTHFLTFLFPSIFPFKFILLLVMPFFNRTELERVGVVGPKTGLLWTGL